MQEIVVTETIEGTPFVGIIMQRNIQGTGRIVPFAVMILRQSSMSITERMNTTLKNWKILLLTYPLDAQSAERLSPLGTTVIRDQGMSTGARPVLKRRWNPTISERNIKSNLSIVHFLLPSPGTPGERAFLSD